MSQDTRDLAVRLDRLEQQNKRLKRWGTGLALGLGLVTLASAKLVCDTVTGERLVIHDPSGRTRVTVDAYSSETPGLTFHNRDGRASARMAVDEKSGEFVVSVFDAKGAVKNSWRLGEAPKTQEQAKPEPKGDGPVSMLR